MQNDIAAHQTRRQNEKVKNVLFDLEVGKQLKEREDSLKEDIKQKNADKQNECKKLAQFLKDQIAEKKQSEAKNTCKQSTSLQQYFLRKILSAIQIELNVEFQAYMHFYDT